MLSSTFLASKKEERRASGLCSKSAVFSFEINTFPQNEARNAVVYSRQNRVSLRLKGVHNLKYV